MPVNIPQGGFSPEQQAMIDQRFGTGSQYGSGTSAGPSGQSPGFSMGRQGGLGGQMGPQQHGGKPGGPGGQMGPQQPGGKPGGPGGQQQAGKPGGPGGQAGPQPGMPPPTGKPGMPPVNPGGLAQQRPQMGNGLLGLQRQPGVLDQARVDMGAAPQPSPTGPTGPYSNNRYGMPY